MENWYYAQGGQQAGPYSTEQLQQFIAAGQVNGNDPVWKDGMTQWAPIRSVPELAALLPSQLAAPATLNYAMPVSAGSGVLATGKSLEMLRQTKPWVRLISIVMIVGAVLMFFVAIITFTIGASRGPFGGVQGLVIIGVSLLYMAPAYYLSQYATAIGRLTVTRRDADLEEALRWQKSFWKFSGILTLIIICFYALAFLCAFAVGARLFRF